MNIEKYVVGQEVIFKWHFSVINARISKILATTNLYEIDAYKGHPSVPYKINVLSYYLQNNMDLDEQNSEKRIMENNAIFKNELIERVWAKPNEWLF
jgi:hypothetical protein